MKPLTIFITFIIIFFTGFVIFFGQEVFSPFFNDVKIFLASFSFEGKYQNYNFLIQENERLKFELQEYKNGNNEENNDGKIAEVFSRYPFNNRESIIVNLGKKDEIKINSPVLTSTHYLLGKVVSVQNNQSEVETIFSPEWKSSVALKIPEFKAVLQGGQTPKLKLISKEADIKNGDFVFNISPDFPYKKLIGEVENIEKNLEETWYKANLRIPYDIDEITEVIILTDFK